MLFTNGIYSCTSCKEVSKSCLIWYKTRNSYLCMDNLFRRWCSNFFPGAHSPIFPIFTKANVILYIMESSTFFFFYSSSQLVFVCYRSFATFSSFVLFRWSFGRCTTIRFFQRFSTSIRFLEAETVDARAVLLMLDDEKYTEKNVVVVSGRMSTNGKDFFLFIQFYASVLMLLLFSSLAFSLFVWFHLILRPKTLTIVRLLPFSIQRYVVSECMCLEKYRRNTCDVY